MTNAIKSITIVGGGTTGWLAALYLAKKFERAVQSGLMTISLIESAKIPIIGVGESLSPSMPVTLQSLGISERQFIRETDASFKLAGYFVDWERNGDGATHSWINPFVGYLTAGYEFERFELENNADYGRTVSPCRDVIEQKKGPRKIGDADYSSVLRYAYHTDATKFAPFLKRNAIELGVLHRIDDVVDAKLDERGYVGELILEAGGAHPVELVIDATGFASAILHKKLGVPLRDYSSNLMNNRAIVAQVPNGDDAHDIEPATRSTALPHGWAFRVPLYGRTGNGYVFCDKFISDDEATAEFLKYLGAAADTVQPRAIPMRVGRAERAWEKNCIALGLAAGFVEPLEASAIYSVETCLKWLVNYFPTADFPDALRNRYNDRVADLYDEVVDYIVLHYKLSKRDDSEYWLTQRNEIRCSDRLAENLAVWQHALPVRGDFASTNYFDHNTYIAALFGKNFYSGGELHPEQVIDRDEWLGLRDVIDQTHKRALASLPGHRQLLASLRA
jgi:flavin-dependent dehydrogenase